MRVSSDRRWHFDLTPAAFWATIVDVDGYQQWWPWLREFDAATLAVGERWACVVQPPLPYRLRFHLDLVEVIDTSVVAVTVAGDIVGDARLEVAETARGCDVRLVANLAPAHPMLRAVAKVAAPVARYGHDWVLDTGARQFRRAIDGS